jgi:hypothetical protein
MPKESSEDLIRKLSAALAVAKGGSKEFQKIARELKELLVEHLVKMRGKPKRRPRSDRNGSNR